MRLRDIFSPLEAKKIRVLSGLDQFLIRNQQIIEGVCKPADHVNGVPVRVSTAIVVCRKNNDIYAYRRTDNYVWMANGDHGGPRRGVIGYWDTPKGRTAFVNPGKWLVDENLVTGKFVDVGIATEYRPFPEIDEKDRSISIPAEFVIMPTILFRADKDGEAVLTDHLDQVPNKEKVKVEGFAWVPAAEISADNAMTKLVTAVQML